MPELASFRQLHRDVAEVVGFNYDNPDAAQLREDVQRLGVEIPVLVSDPAGHFGFTAVEALPVTWVVYQGQAIQALLGPQTEDSLLQVVSDIRSVQEGNSR
jgi:hypothetical protein